MLAMPPSWQFLQTFLSSSRSAQPKGTLGALRAASADFAAFFASEEVQLRLPLGGGRFDFLRFVSADTLPLWLTDYTRPSVYDTESRYMPGDAELKAELAATGSYHVTRAQRLALACVLAPDAQLTEWTEATAPDLVSFLLSQPTVAAFNGHVFDNQLLARYASEAQQRGLYLRMLDVMDVLQYRRGERKMRSLNAHATELLNRSKLDLTSLLGEKEALSVPARFRRGTPTDMLAIRLYCEGDCSLADGLM
ncbi:hypothetical protein, partial [Corallococcus terminator]